MSTIKDILKSEYNRLLEYKEHLDIQALPNPNTYNKVIENLKELEKIKHWFLTDADDDR